MYVMINNLIYLKCIFDLINYALSTCTQGVLYSRSTWVKMRGLFVQRCIRDVMIICFMYLPHITPGSDKQTIDH